MNSAKLFLITSLLVSTAWATDELALDVHGSMAAGYVVSDGNNLLGSSRNGSNDLVEVAINARTTFGAKLLLAGQLMARKSGTADDGSLRLDYLQLDYQAWQSMNGVGGLRVGKLKNPFGFYNASRDVVFSRPGILLPTVYLEDTGIRDLLFASEGAQLYASLDGFGAVSDWVIGWGRNRDATEELQRVFGANQLDGQVNLNNFMLAQWMTEWLGGGLRTGVSYLAAELELRNSSTFPDLCLSADLWMLSLQSRWANGDLTFEYRLSDSTTSGAFSSRSKGDAAYLQYRYTPGPKWSAYLRYDLNYLDRNDRDGHRRVAAGQGPRYAAFGRDHVVGAQWTPDEHWGVFAEYHYVDGTASVRAQDNAGRTPERYWQALLLMVAYQF